MTDLVIAAGGSVLMSEVPGIPGCEHIVASRAVSREAGEQILGMVDELRAEFGPDLNEGGIAVLPSPDETHPNILIKAKDCAFDEGYRELTW